MILIIMIMETMITICILYMISYTYMFIYLLIYVNNTSHITLQAMHHDHDCCLSIRICYYCYTCYMST